MTCAIPGQSNMLRLEARDNARLMKDDLEKAFQSLAEPVRTSRVRLHASYSHIMH